MLSLSESQLKKYRGKDIAMVMQQGSRAFDPSTTVGKQMFEMIRKYIRQCLHKKLKIH